MLEITPDQYAAMQADAEAGFRRRLHALLAAQYPDYARDPRAVAGVIDLGIRDARAAGLRSERGLAAWVIAAFLLGELNDDPYIIAEIRESGASEATKIETLEGYVAAIAEALEG